MALWLMVPMLPTWVPILHKYNDASMNTISIADNNGIGNLISVDEIDGSVIGNDNTAVKRAHANNNNNDASNGNVGKA